MWVLLHGFTGSPESWHRVIEKAELRDDPLIPALTGHGPKWRDIEAHSFEGEVSRLADMVSELERPRLIAGYSMGARLALGLLVTYPGLFDAAVLIGVHPGLADESAVTARRALDQERARFLRSEGLDAFVQRWEREPLFRTQRSLPATLIERQRILRLSHEAEGLAHALEVLGLAEMPNYGAAMDRIDVPVITMAGSHDSKFSQLARAMAREHAVVQERIIDGAGHNLLLEAPAAVAQALADAEGEAP
ncbi:MAG TPA: alpha/beta fold hydrolase [Polyangiales bacterium]|nr:alpha/beta fold hydrolase [Polyangiales bacterium]